MSACNTDRAQAFVQCVHLLDVRSRSELPVSAQVPGPQVLCIRLLCVQVVSWAQRPMSELRCPRCRLGRSAWDGLCPLT